MPRVVPPRAIGGAAVLGLVGICLLVSGTELLAQIGEPVPALPPAAPGPAAGTYTQIEGFSDWFRRGGVVMYPLALCSLVALGFILERFFTLRRATADLPALMRATLKALEAGGADSAIDVCRRSRGPVARILHAGLSRARRGSIQQVERAIESAGSIEVAFLQRGLLWLATVANVAPLLGFLGTVSGMIHAFATIAAADQITARLVAGGIQEALITTEAGLSIAIPVQAVHNYFVGRIDRFITQMEEGSIDLIATLEEGRGPEGTFR